ncbi:TonB-dependent siderophore receptor [Pseudomonas sp. NPDC007930]|uniref:TonB-dependent siderophore receptor n=1 Tax=Pseudomonas sp. NPDC007930 TaxID=3364417 RepID=UPI0036E8A9C5
MPPAFTLRPLSLAVALGALLPLAASLLHAPLVMAQGQTVAFNVAAGPLAQALYSFGHQANLLISFAPAQVEGRASPGLQGTYGVEQGFAQLLAGSGLQAVPGANGSYTLQALPEGNLVLPTSSISGTAVGEGYADDSAPGLVAKRSSVGTKTDTPLHETAQAISVITRDQLDARNVASLNDALHYTAGVNTSYSNDTRNDAFNIRGFSSDFFYLDGTRLPAVSGRGLDQFRVDPYQLERIEVLKGVSSVMYGLGEPGGVVNMVSKLPTAEARGQVDAQLGNHDRYQLGTDVSGPLDAEGNVLYRVIAQQTGSHNQVDYVKGTRTLLAPSLTFNPQGDTRLTLMASYLHDDTMDSNNFLPYYGTVKRTALGQRLSTHLATSNPGYENYDKEQFSLGYLLEHDLNDNWTLRQNLRYAHLTLDNQALFGYALSGDQQSIARAAMNLQSSFNDVDLDNQLQGHFSTGALAHTFLAGLNYTNQNFYDSEGYGYGYLLNLYNPTALHDAVAKPSFNDTQTHQVQRQTGVYLQDQIALERWRLTVSGRQDWVNTRTLDNLADTRSHASDSAFSGRLGLLYLFDNGLAPYLSYATSFQPLIGTDAYGSPYTPLKSKQWEAGLKYQPKALNATFSAAVFDLRQQDALTEVPDTDLNGSIQAGEIRSRGLELEATAQLTPALKLLAAYTLQDVEVTKGSAADASTGQRPTAIPRQLASLWLDYTLQGGPLRGLGFGAGAQYVGSTYADTANTLKVDGFTVADAALHYDLPAWRFVLSANNLFDQQYVARCGSATRCQYGERREVLLSARYAW